MEIVRFVRKNPLAAVLSVALAFALGSNLWLRFRSDTIVLSDDAIREELLPVAKLTSYEMNFTELMFLDEANNPFDITNPITSKRFVATIDGDVQITTDVSALELEVKRAADRGVDAVRVRLPHAQAENPNLDSSTLKVYIEDKGIFDLYRPTVEDYNKLEKQAEANQVKKIKESDALEKADERIVEILTSFLHQLLGDDVDVKVSFK